MKTIGTDVEVFARNDVEHISLCGLIGGTKDAPLQVASLPKGFCVQEDNVSLEFNIPPARNSYEFLEHMRVMSQYIPQLLKYIGLNISKECAVSFSKEQLTHPNALIFGCEPDYNAWTMVENTKPISDDATLRTAGGHIHVGTQENMINVVKWMDVFLGVPSVILDNSEGSVRRRQMYGKAGAMRPKPYGLEYRVLSNFWIFHADLCEWVFNSTELAVERARKGAPSIRMQKQVVSIINNGDVEKAVEFCQKNGVMYEIQS